MTREQFIEKAESVHGTIYGYDSVIYLDSHTNVKIECRKHGAFLQTPTVHLRPAGCRLCGFERIAQGKLMKGRETFIANANRVHDMRYDYSKVDYITSRDKVEIICPAHGLFTQIPADHIAGKGCWKCGMENRSIARKKSISKFIADAQKIHGDLYDYSSVNYVNNLTKIEIICIKHGIFMQVPGAHLTGQGCPSCAHRISRGETEWLDHLGITKRQVTLDISDRTIQADGFDADSNTIYLYHGDFWHGNPSVYAPEEINLKIGCRMGYLFERTMAMEDSIRRAGYHLVTIWERNWKGMRIPFQPQSD